MFRWRANCMISRLTFTITICAIHDIAIFAAVIEPHLGGLMVNVTGGDGCVSRVFRGV